ncbi:hypothetical protein SNE40_017397 [Patella caerulea]|uniref:Uncharacterized protein n=1 Tax=Patella caerulea TaxID=87958 RepID=A0AAN8JDU9_PATCE
MCTPYVNTNSHIKRQPKAYVIIDIMLFLKQMKTPMFTSDGYWVMAIDNDLDYIKFDLKGGEIISKYKPPKQLEQYEEVFKPTDDIVELTIPDTVLFDTPDPDTDESDVTTDDDDDEDDDKKNDGANKMMI